MSIDNVSVTISVQDKKVTQLGFGTIMLLDLHTAFVDRTKSYASLTEVGSDFATTTKLYKAAAAIFAQSPSPETIKIGRVDAGDADMTATLDAINLVDSDWYELRLISKVTADITAAAAWIETQVKIHGLDTENTDVPTAVTTDIASVLQAANYNRTYTMYHHQSGVDVASTAIAVTSEVATVTQVSHGLRVNDPVTISGATDAGADPDVLNGNFVVASVPTTGTWTYAAPGATDGAATGTITYFARYTFPECAWSGQQMSEDPGATTWKFKTLAGITATPQTLMNTSEQAIVEGKNANIYVERAGVSITREGVMSSGRFIDIQRGIDWLDARMEEAIFGKLVNLKKIPYTNAGLTIIEGAIREVLNLALSRTVISPLDPDNGIDYELVIPDVADISSADRLNRLFPDITFRALVGSAVHGVEVTGTLEV